MKKIILIFICILTLSGCTSNSDTTPVVTMEIEDYGTITIELYPKYAPKTVANFISLIQDGFYDGLTFHRYVEDFVLQGGDPNGDGTGGSSETIYGEFSANGYNKNTLSHTTGVISMARSSAYDSASSQFFIVLSDNYTTSLDGLYAAFGKVVDGWDVIEAIESDAEVEDESTGKLKENIVISKVTVELNGYKTS